MHLMYLKTEILFPNDLKYFHFTADAAITEAAWCQDIDCGTSVAKNICPTTCQKGGNIVLNKVIFLIVNRYPITSKSDYDFCFLLLF